MLMTNAWLRYDALIRDQAQNKYWLVIDDNNYGMATMLHTQTTRRLKHVYINIYTFSTYEYFSFHERSTLNQIRFVYAVIPFLAFR